MMRIKRVIGAVVFAAGAAWVGRAEVSVRARVTEMEPEAFVRIFWTWGGQGLGGDPVSGEWTEIKFGQPKPPDLGEAKLEEDPFKELFDQPAATGDYLVEKGKASDYRWLRKGIWSPELPLSAFRSGGLYFVTVYANGCQPENIQERIALTRAVFEFEIRENGKPLKTFTEASPSGAVGTIILPIRALKDGQATPVFLEEARGLSALIRWRRDFMEGLPWAKDRLPERYEFITDCGGYGTQHGYGVRTSNRDILFDEFRIMRQMGVNGLRGKPFFFNDFVLKNDPAVQGLIRLTEGGAGGYPFIPAPRDHNTGVLHPLPWPEGAGCPYHPLYSNRADQARAEFKATLDRARKLPFATWWCLTVDEIGSAFDSTGEGKAHMGVCPHCTARFRDYLRGHGLTPQDFDARDWDPVRPTMGYFDKSHEQRERERMAAIEAGRAKPGLAQAEFAGQTTGAETLITEALADEAAAAGKKKPVPATGGQSALTADETVVDLSDEAAAQGGDEAVAQALAEEAQREGIPPSPTPALSAHGWHKLNYGTRRFNSDGSSMLFTPMRDAFAEANAAKRKAIAEGRIDTVEARQPWMFMYALRGNTFLMGGHSLGFFDFYRNADTGFMYETSNRDPRVWPWDSYLCDVGRILKEKMGLEFGIYVKPHRGAGTQRALAAVARGVRCIYWYTYGPDWAKGDTFGGNTNVMKIVSRAARLIGEAEPVTWEGRWSKPAEIAVVRPRTSQFFGNSAQWEDGKWVYAALTHAHLPMDPLDEEFLVSEDLGRYKAIYLTGSHLRRAVVPRLVSYVENGGTLFTGCGGLMRDEAGKLIAELLPVFGVSARTQPVLWGQVPKYGATSLGAVRAVSNAPADAVVSAKAGAAFPLQVGYEKLQPLPETEVLATFGDGAAALTRHAFGKGQAWLAGWYTGVEYATGVMKQGYDTSVDFSPEQRDLIAAAARLAGVRPVVETSHPLVEGVRMLNPASGREAVVLMNWARKGRDLVPFTDLTVRLPDAGAWKGARSVWQRRAVPVEKSGNDLLIRVGEMDDGDVLLLE